MKYKAQMSFGDSIGYYGDKQWDEPPHGTIQGNGTSLLIWVAVSSVLFECLKRDRCKAILTSPITHHMMKVSGFAFVDDTDLISTGKDTTTGIGNILTRIGSPQHGNWTGWKSI